MYKWPIFLLCGASIVLAAQDKIPACLLTYQFGPEHHVLIVEKATQTLYVYNNYQAQPVEKFKITTGRNTGQKQEEGDMRTPEGIYFFRAILTGNALPKAEDYGEKAFVMTYPNPIDAINKRNGSGIWLHGAFDKGKLASANNSRGCVVLKNDDLAKISKYILLFQTPICVYNQIVYDTPEKIKTKREELLARVMDWKKGWENKDINRYISYFNVNFRSNGMSLQDFRRYKDNLNQQYEFIRVFLSDIRLYTLGETSIATFQQLYLSDKNHFNALKTQYWLADKNQPTIIDEETHSLPVPSRIQLRDGQFVSVEQFRQQMLKGLAPDVQLQGVAEKEVIKAVPAVASQTPPVFGNVSLPPLPFAAIIVKAVEKASSAVTMTIHCEALPESLLVIPVVLLKDKDTTLYQSLKQIVLKAGVPQNYADGQRLQPGSNHLSVENKGGYEVKSVTLFVVDDKNDVRQILTYFVGR